jgi:hypothetical protein
MCPDALEDAFDVNKNMAKLDINKIFRDHRQESKVKRFGIIILPYQR